MKIFSWNVNGIRAVEKKGALGEFLREKNPDIVCFQETKIQGEQVSKENFDEKYPEFSKFWSFAERKGYAGTAIWSKIPPKFVAKNLSREILEKFDLSDKFGNAAHEGRICAADFGDFWLLTVYTPNTKSGLERLDLRQKWDSAFLEFAKGLKNGEFSAESFDDFENFEASENFKNASKNDKISPQISKKSTKNFSPKPVIFCGDLNVAHEEIDLARPKQNRGEHGFTDEERAGFSKFVAENFVDTLREQNPETPELYTWWSHFGKARERNVGWRIDYFLTSQNFFEKQKMKAEIHPQIIGSDHCPVSIEWSEKDV